MTNFIFLLGLKFVTKWHAQRRKSCVVEKIFSCDFKNIKNKKALNAFQLSFNAKHKFLLRSSDGMFFSASKTC